MSIRSLPSRKLLAAAAVVLCGAAQGQGIPGMGTWETSLQARDINGDAVVDAYYDTALDITWLANAMGTLGTPYDDGANTTNGESTWATARTWAAGLDVFGVTGWRLPRFTAGVPGPSEVSFMHCTTLGNNGTSCNPGPLPRNFVNPGPFENLSNNWVWLDNADLASATPHAWVWVGDAVGGYHSSENVMGDYSAWAVRDGDVPVAVVPEPSTWALMLAGLGVVGFMRRRRATR